MPIRISDRKCCSGRAAEKDAGVEVDSDGKITVNEGRSRRSLVDGEEFFSAIRSGIENSPPRWLRNCRCSTGKRYGANDRL
jgi:hypothetical protein